MHTCSSGRTIRKIAYKEVKHHMTSGKALSSYLAGRTFEICDVPYVCVSMLLTDAM